MFIFEVSDSICSSGGIASILLICKRLLLFLEILAPILLIISLTMIFIQLAQNPDNSKKILPKIKNSVLATAILFFIPVIVNVVMSICGSNYDISRCYNGVRDYFKDNKLSYYEIDDKDKVNIIGNVDYESGKVTNYNSNNSSNNNNSNTNVSNNNGNVNASASAFLSSLEKMSNYVRNDSKNTWYYLWDGSSKTFDDAVSKNNKHLTCISLPNWGLRDIGVLTPSQQFNQSPSKNNLLVYKNGAKEAIEKYGTIYHYGLSKSFNQVVSEIGLAPGDIFIWDSHANVFAGYNNKGKTTFYDSGRGGDGKYVNGTFYFNSLGPKIMTFNNSKVRDVIRLNK